MQRLNEIVKEMEEIKQLPDLALAKEKLNLLWTELYQLEREKPHIKQSEQLRKLTPNILQIEESPFYIIDQNPNMDVTPYSSDDLRKICVNELTMEQLQKVLDTIVYDTRNFLANLYHIDINTHHLTGFCINATNYICYNYHRFFDVFPQQAHTTFHQNLHHYFAVITLDTVEGGKRYIIDPTYRQFCLMSKCHKDRIYHYYQNQISPGYFFYDKPILRQLLEKGYIEATNSNVVSYGRSFVLGGISLENRKQKKLVIPKPNVFSSQQYVNAFHTGELIK